MQTYIDPATNRPYYIDPATNQAVWADTQPAPVAPVAPVAAVPAAPMPVAGVPAFDPTQMAAAAAAMGVAPVQPAGAGVETQIDLSAYDFSQVKDKIIMVLDPTIQYEFFVESVKGKKSSSNEDMIEVHLSVTFPEKLPNGEPCKGASIIDNVTLAGNALWKAKSFFAACELLGPNGRFSGNTINDLVGCVVRAGVRNEVWNEQTRTKIATGYKAAFETPGMTHAHSAAGPTGFVPPASPVAAMPGVPGAPLAPAGPTPAPVAPVQPMAPVVGAPGPAPAPVGVAPAPGPAPQPVFPAGPVTPAGAPAPAPAMPAPPAAPPQ